MVMAAGASKTQPDVNLSTAEAVQAILEAAEGPVTRYYILKELSNAGRTTVQARLNRALDYFFSLGLAIEGSKGVQWTHNPSPSLRNAIATGKRL